MSISSEASKSSTDLSPITKTRIPRILSQHEIKKDLHYNPKTGVFKHLVFSPGKRPTLIAGTTDPKGHVHIQIGIYIYSASRLAWVYVYGTKPKGKITHLNGITSDNRIDNLMDMGFLKILGITSKEFANHG